jgi:hypothetical protein
MTTPFTVRLVELLECRERTPPAIAPSAPVPWQVGVSKQAALRSRAERLIGQANAALRRFGTEIAVEDQAADELIGFTLRFEGRTLRICTRRVSGDAFPRFDGWGSRCSQAVQLAGPEALEDAILLLVTGATRTP